MVTNKQIESNLQKKIVRIKAANLRKMVANKRMKN